MNKLLLLFVCFLIGILLFTLLNKSCEYRVVEGLVVGETVIFIDEVLYLAMVMDETNVYLFEIQEMRRITDGHILGNPNDNDIDTITLNNGITVAVFNNQLGRVGNGMESDDTEQFLNNLNIGQHFNDIDNLIHLLNFYRLLLWFNNGGQNAADNLVEDRVVITYLDERHRALPFNEAGNGYIDFETFLGRMELENDDIIFILHREGGFQVNTLLTTNITEADYTSWLNNPNAEGVLQYITVPYMGTQIEIPMGFYHLLTRILIGQYQPFVLDMRVLNRVLETNYNDVGFIDPVPRQNAVTTLINYLKDKYDSIVRGSDRANFSWWVQYSPRGPRATWPITDMDNATAEELNNLIVLVRQWEAADRPGPPRSILERCSEFLRTIGGGGGSGGRGGATRSIANRRLPYRRI